MDGITFGVIYSIVSVMSFDLKLLPMEELWRDGYEGVDPNTGTARWRQSGPGTVEWTNSAFESKRVYQVDSSGRILSSDYHFLDTVARIKTEYRYAGGHLERIVWKHDGRLTDVETFTWSGGDPAATVRSGRVEAGGGARLAGAEARSSEIYFEVYAQFGTELEMMHRLRFGPIGP